MGKKPITKEEIQARKEEIMEQCYECYADQGFHGTGIKALAKYCGCTSANLYTYFENVDDLIVQSTEYCMSKVEDDFMSLAPRTPEEAIEFIRKIPYWTAEKHGKKYKLMYQVYTHPKYNEYGKAFFNGVNHRYTEYAKQIESSIGIPHDTITSLIFILVRACVHYALFEDEYYLQMQLRALESALRLLIDKNFAQCGNIPFPAVEGPDAEGSASFFENH